MPKKQGLFFGRVFLCGGRLKYKNGCTNQVDAPAKRSYFIFIKGKLFALLTTGTAFAICRFATGTTGTFFPTFGLFFEHTV